MGDDIFGGGSTKVKSRPAKAFKKPLQDIGLGMTDPALRQQQMGKLVFDPAAMQGIGSQLQNTAFGGNLDVANSPAVKNLLAALQGSSSQMLNQAMKDVRSRAALAGHTSVGGSSPLQNALLQAGDRASTGFAAATAPSLFNQYADERQKQMQALGAYGQYQMMPYNILSQIASNFQNSTTNTPTSPLAFLAK